MQSKVSQKEKKRSYINIYIFIYIYDLEKWY